MQVTKPLTVYLPDTRDVVLSRYSRAYDAWERGEGL